MKHFSIAGNFVPNRFVAAILWTAMLAFSAPLHASGGGMGNSDSCGSCHGVNANPNTFVGPVTATGAIGNTLTLKQGQLLVLELGPSGGRGFSAAITKDGSRVALAGTLLTSANAQIFSSYYFTHTSNTGGGPYRISYNTTNIPIGTYVIDSVMRAAGSGWQNGTKITLNIETAIGAPGTPTIGTATASNRQVNVYFTPTGAAATDFTATCNGFATGTGTASPVTVAVDNGPTYTCSVTARNAAGTSAASAVSNQVIPNNRPAAPTNVVATRGNNEVSVSFNPIPPGDTGGSAINLYTATCPPLTGTNTASPVKVQNLSNGTAVTCTVTATNIDRGTSLPSAASNSVTPAGPPDAPRVFSAPQPGDKEAKVYFDAPFDTGGVPITSYTATCIPQQGAIAASAPDTASPLTVKSLVNGTPYTCSVTATNVAGLTSAASAAFPVTPVAAAAPAVVAPGAPTITSVVAGNNLLTVNFSAPGNPGSGQISGYSATCTPQQGGAASPSFPGGATATSIDVTGLANGTPYTCRVRITTTAGFADSVPSSPAVAPVAPAAAVVPPGAPTITSVVPGATRLTVNFNAPGILGSGQVSGYSATCTTQQGGVTTAPFLGGTSPTPIDVTGLASSTAYACRVKFTTSAGSAESVSFPATTLAAAAPAPVAAGMPTINLVVPGDKVVRVDFTPASSDVGAMYIAHCGIVPGTPSSTPTTGDQNSRSLTVRGLENNTRYTCTVASRIGNTSANSLPSAVVIPVAPTPVGKPDIVFSSPPPTVNPQTVIVGGQVRLGPVTVFTMKNQGTAPTGPFRFGVYLSRDATITTADTFLNFASSDFNIAAGAEASFGNVNVTIPLDTVPGNYYIGMLADDNNRVDESNEGNNFTSSLITITAPAAGAKPDIKFTMPLLAVTPNSVSPGAQVRLNLNGSLMTNVGTVATGPFRFGVYLSRDQVINTSDTFLNFASQDFNLAPGATAGFGDVIVTIPMGTPPGNYFIGILADDNNRVSESNENNNYGMVPITIR